MGLLDGRVAIVTGAGGGLGRAHALALAAEGAKVVVNDLGGARDGAGSGTAMADQVVAEIREAGGEAVPSYGSVATMEGGEAIVKTAVDAFGRLDIVVNNAGILRDKTLVKLTEAMWDSVVAVHLKGTFAVTQPAVRQMIAQGEGGRIINTSSYAGLKGNFGQANYGAAKAGIAGFTRVLGIELGRYQIAVNAIAPLAKTRMTDDIDMVSAEITPDQIAPFVVFLASGLSDGVTGRIFGVHGPELFEYKQVMTPMVVKEEGIWTVAEIADRMAEIGREPRFVDPGAETAGKSAAVGPAERVAALFHAMPTAFKKDRAGDWAATLHFDVQGTGVFTLEVAGGQCTVEDGAQGNPTATVTFDSAETILGMASGEVQPQQAFMAGKIKATDLGALMKFGQFFSMKRAKAAADQVLGGESGGESESPEQIVDMIFERMPEGFLPEQAEGWNAVLHFEIGGIGGYTVAIEKGTCRTLKGKEGAPRATITFADADTLVGMVRGEVKPEAAFMAGHIKADNLGELMKFGKCFDLKKGAEEARKLAAGDGQDEAPAREGVNTDLIGKRYKAGAILVTPEQAAAYAEATNDDNPHYQPGNGEQLAPPLYSANPLMDAVAMLVADRSLNVDLLRLVHGEQEMIFHKPLVPWMLVNPRAEVHSVEDKSSGQLLRAKQYLWADGELVSETLSGYFIRGPKRAAKSADAAKPKPAPAEPAERELLFEEVVAVDADQPVRYAHASGDMNPLHTDPEVARSAGLPNVILHGMCTMAFAQKAVIDQHLGGDPTRLRRLKVRFAKMVFPGDVLTTRAWLVEQTAERTILGFETVNQDGEAVLSHAEAEVVDG